MLKCIKEREELGFSSDFRAFYHMYVGKHVEVYCNTLGGTLKLVQYVYHTTRRYLFIVFQYHHVRKKIR